MKITITNCRHCKEEFESRVVKGEAYKKYCSRQCKGKAHPPGKKCIEASRSTKCNEMRKARMTGEGNPMWKGGDSDKERRNRDYKQWRIKVFERDKYKCQKCGYYNGCGEKRKDLNAHHIVAWIDSIELRYEIDNGITLCVPCHIKIHTDKD